ncbi:hypothetical protein CDD83_10219 [Cordyceps sp. RAO-2017]|nr:hypothetical protein CDD83_10219 [Cordyceps sp. RAO-2017]
MARLLLVTTLCAAAAATAWASSSSSYCRHVRPAVALATVPGVEYRLLLGGLARPRAVVEDGEGNVLLVESKDRGVTRVVLSGGDDGGCVEAKAEPLIRDRRLNHGLALSADGRTLFASSASDVYAYAYDAVSGTAGPARHVIGGMQQGGHATRTLLAPALHPDLLLVSRGSDGNVDPGTADVGSARSQIRVFRIAELLARRGKPVPYAAGAVLGWGLRNSVGVAQEPTTGNIWSVENSLDDMRRGGRDIHNGNPGEELNLHGRPDDVHGPFYGRNYGYPACVTVFDPAGVGAYPGGAATGQPMAGDHMPANYSDGWCRRETLAPRLTFDAHLAPLGLAFADDGSAAYISFHGSWNRRPGIGYRVSRVAFADGQPVHASDSRDAEEKLLWNADESLCPYRCFRPVGLAVGRGGDRIFVTSDATGELVLLTGSGGRGYGRRRPGPSWT